MRRMIAPGLALVLVVAACGGDDGADTGGEAVSPTSASSPTEAASPTGGTSPAAPASPTDPSTPTETAAASTVAVASTDLGDILVDGEGRTLYLFDNDSGGSSTCTGDCASTWPPLAGPAEAGEGADAALLGTTTRDDGREQVTYAGHPLYHFAGDSAPGDVAGQGRGEVWWVVSPAGEALRSMGDAASRGPDY